MKIIDLLNKIAKGKELPKKIKYLNHIWELVNRSYFCNGTDMLEDYIANGIIQSLNDEIEIIKEQPEIDIQGIEEISIDKLNGIDPYVIITKPEVFCINKQNELIRAVKQLDNKIKGE